MASCRDLIYVHPTGTHHPLLFIKHFAHLNVSKIYCLLVLTLIAVNVVVAANILPFGTQLTLFL
jgi:hypothetical protein